MPGDKHTPGEWFRSGTIVYEQPATPRDFLRAGVQANGTTGGTDAG